ncbi:MAG: regulatory protein RecX [Spirochaetaceae bacterium]
MDSAELEESSSSPNDKRNISSITEGAGGGQCEIMLTDGSSFYVRPKTLHTPPFKGIKEGDRVSEALYQLLVEETITFAAKRKALDYLARREHSRFELRRKLLHKEFPRPQVETVLDECEQAGYLDDQRFARLWAESRIKKRTEGPVKVAAKLAEKGVSREIAEKVVAELFTDKVIETSLRAAEEKGRRKHGEDEAKVVKYLYSRGFTMEHIYTYRR